MRGVGQCLFGRDELEFARDHAFMRRFVYFFTTR
jgi:hypothetical protein